MIYLCGIFYVMIGLAFANDLHMIRTIAKTKLYEWYPVLIFMWPLYVVVIFIFLILPDSILLKIMGE